MKIPLIRHRYHPHRSLCCTESMLLLRHSGRVRHRTMPTNTPRTCAIVDGFMYIALYCMVALHCIVLYCPLQCTAPVLGTAPHCSFQSPSLPRPYHLNTPPSQIDIPLSHSGCRESRCTGDPKGRVLYPFHCTTIPSHHNSSYSIRQPAHSVPPLPRLSTPPSHSISILPIP
jgi:hypothetical protein